MLAPGEVDDSPLAAAAAAWPVFGADDDGAADSNEAARSMRKRDRTCILDWRCLLRDKDSARDDAQISETWGSGFCTTCNLSECLVLKESVRPSFSVGSLLEDKKVEKRC